MAPTESYVHLKVGSKLVWLTQSDTLCQSKKAQNKANSICHTGTLILWLISVATVTHRGHHFHDEAYIPATFPLDTSASKTLLWSHDHSLVFLAKSTAGGSRPRHRLFTLHTLKHHLGHLYGPMISRSNTGVSKSNVAVFYHLGWVFSWYFG